MNEEQAPGEASFEVETDVALEGQPLPEDASVVAAFPGTVGPCDACRRAVTRALGDNPGFPLWFHLGRPGLCLRHSQGVKASG